MSQAERAYSRRPREQRVAEIMQAARVVFADKGYDAASVAEIAERAGVVEGSVYRYFEHKRALLVRVVEDWYEELLSDYDEHLRGIDGTWNRLRYMIWRHVAAIHKEPALCRLVFSELRPDPAYRSTTVFELNRRYTRRTIEILRAGVARGEIRDDVPLPLVRDMIYGAVEHATWAYLRGEGTLAPEACADGILSVLRGGLAATNAKRGDTLDRAVARLERLADRIESPSTDNTVTEARRRVPTRAGRKPR